jgi:hypothetical protein
MRSQYVPEAVRSTVMNMFRIPLNMFVCIVLYNVRRPCRRRSWCPGGLSRRPPPSLPPSRSTAPLPGAALPLQPLHQISGRSSSVRLAPTPLPAQVSAFPLPLMFGMCCCFLLIASAAQRQLEVLTRVGSGGGGERGGRGDDGVEMQAAGKGAVRADDSSL